MAYIAGFIDADGSVTAHRAEPTPGKYFYRVRVTATNADREVLMSLLNNFGGSISLHNPRAPRHHNTVWRWTVSNRPAVSDMLTQLLPYMRVKRSRSVLVLAMISELLGARRSSRFHTLFTNIRALNKRGRAR